MTHKENIIFMLHNILSKNVLGDKQYQSRYKGFIGELEFQRWINSNRDPNIFFDGGYFLPTKQGNRSIHNPIYFTVSSDSEDRYIDIYSSLSKLNCQAMFFIKWNKSINFSHWTQDTNLIQGSNIKIPHFESILIFNHKSSTFEESSLDLFLDFFPLKPKRTQSRPIPENVFQYWADKLLKFDEKLLMNLYVERLIFDAFIGYSRRHGIPSDIDSIVYSQYLNNYILLEIKEKDLSKTPPTGFGMDVPRIQDLNTISDLTNLPFYYIVRHITDQTNRSFIEWRIISLNKFTKNIPKNTIQGGSGMGFEKGKYPTKICPYKYFSTIQ